ncbi:hypothetical protein [Thalassotalea sp. SU-HH00458]|uniref:hypothetical protein n=1 Tax=Thalassotalea sp. SU-HH00458 TaxID=3127657 RepID=UPI003108F1AC
MLINTVILFLKDLLPIFILFCLLKANLANMQLSKRTIGLIFLASGIGIFATFKWLPFISELWGGAGIEILTTFEILLVYLALGTTASFAIKNQPPTSPQLYIVAAAFVVFVVLNTSTFIVFLESYLSNSESINIVVAGLTIGFGISLSFSALLLFLLLWLNKKNYRGVTYTFWTLFLTGQLCEVINLLQQVDIVNMSGALWDSSSFIEDSSEYGHLLNALVGYEAQPSFEFISLYSLSLFMLTSYFYCYAHSKTDESINNRVGN